jgi:hypothetical protein
MKRKPRDDHMESTLSGCRRFRHYNRATDKDKYKVLRLVGKSKYAKKIRRGVYRIEFD